MPEVSAKPGIKLFIYFTFTIVSKEIEPWYFVHFPYSTLWQDILSQPP